MMKNVYLITHGMTDDQPDPGMTSDGHNAICAIRKRLHEFMKLSDTQIVCGVGYRQVQVLMDICGGIPDSVMFCEVWGGAPTLMKTSGPKRILLGDGTEIAFSNYDMKPMAVAIKAALVELPENSLICSGRPVLVRLGLKSEECQSSALYRLRVNDDGSLEHAEILIGGINISSPTAG